MGVGGGEKVLNETLLDNYVCRYVHLYAVLLCVDCPCTGIYRRTDLWSCELLLTDLY